MRTGAERRYRIHVQGAGDRADGQRSYRAVGERSDQMMVPGQTAGGHIQVVHRVPAGAHAVAQHTQCSYYRYGGEKHGDRRARAHGWRISGFDSQMPIFYTHIASADLFRAGTGTSGCATSAADAGELIGLFAILMRPGRTGKHSRSEAGRAGRPQPWSVAYLQCLIEDDSGKGCGWDPGERELLSPRRYTRTGNVASRSSSTIWKSVSDQATEKPSTLTGSARVEPNGPPRNFLSSTRRAGSSGTFASPPWPKRTPPPKVRRSGSSSSLRQASFSGGISLRRPAGRFSTTTSSPSETRWPL